MTSEQAETLIELTETLIAYLELIKNLNVTIICGIGFIGALMFWNMIVRIVRDRQF